MTNLNQKAEPSLFLLRKKNCAEPKAKPEPLKPRRYVIYLVKRPSLLGLFGGVLILNPPAQLFSDRPKKAAEMTGPRAEKRCEKALWDSGSCFFKRSSGWCFLTYDLKPKKTQKSLLDKTSPPMMVWIFLARKKHLQSPN